MINATTSPSPEYKFWVILMIMVLAESCSIMLTELYTPSLPFLTDFFGTAPELLKLTISLNLIEVVPIFRTTPLGVIFHDIRPLLAA